MAHVIVLNEVSEDIFVCGRCKSVFAGIDIFLDHKKICSSSELCSLSLAKQSSNESVSGNTTTCPEVPNANVRNDTTSSEITPGNSLMLQPQTPPLSCTECDKQFKSRRILLIHKKSHYNKKSFQCQICGRCFTQASRLRRHTLSHKVWPVGLGEAISMSVNEELKSVNEELKSVNEELKSVNEELLIRFSCPYCEMSFTSYNEFRSHLKNHQSMKQFKCIQYNCSSFHNSVEELLHHVSLEHASPIYSCFACDEECDTLDAIAKHQLTHKDINCRKKLYKCTQCDAAFNNLENLSFHKLSDNHEKVCIHCNRIFVSDKRLRLHLQLHRDVKPFQCSACDQSFLEKKHFITHLLRHGPKKFKCQICDSLFRRQDHLHRHMSLHDNNKLFKCPYTNNCHKKFNRQDKLKLHIEMHNKVDKEIKKI